MSLSIEEIAKVCHEANRGYCQDSIESLKWL